MTTDPLTPGRSTERRHAVPAESKRAERRRTEIVEAAIRLFSERGYLSTSTKDIGDEIGLLPGSLYYHIRSKEELLYDILLEVHATAMVAMRDIEAGGDDPIERLRRLVRNHVINNDGSRIRLFETDFHHLNHDHHVEILALRRQYLEYVIYLIEEARSAGLCKADVEAWTTATAILGLMNSVPLWFNPTGQYSIYDMADTVESLILGGIGVDDPTV